ncbi:MAG: hypothetical protein KKE20_02565 [Nanoarchaeota archaeon]|nr:hypothetical protein [Nanoarchaeota archaeon]
MTYLSQSGCSSGAYSRSSSGGHLGGCCGSGSSGYSAGQASIIPGYSIAHSIDSVISSYAGPAVSTMESAVQTYQPTFFDVPNSKNIYGVADSINAAIYAGIGSGYQANNNQSRHNNSMVDSFNPNIFLNRDRPAARFIGSSEDIKDYIKDAFEKTAGKALPEDMMIRVVSQNELRELHEEFGGQWNPGIQGFAINKKGFGQSMIICKEDELDRLLVTVGHEIGHVINFPLPEKLDEEAKALAFEMAWLRILQEHNIAGMKRSINLNAMPARNGLHDVAFDFVIKLIRQGRECFDIIKDLMQNKIRVKGDDNVWM